MTILMQHSRFLTSLTCVTAPLPVMWEYRTVIVYHWLTVLRAYLSAVSASISLVYRALSFSHTDISDVEIPLQCEMSYVSNTQPTHHAYTYIHTCTYIHVCFPWGESWLIIAPQETGYEAIIMDTYILMSESVYNNKPFSVAWTPKPGPLQTLPAYSNNNTTQEATSLQSTAINWLFIHWHTYMHNVYTIS